jgi:four helix bundle protein
MRDFRTLLAWQRSHAFALGVYKLTASFPREEMYGLTSQIRRSATSVPANIAEGCGSDGGLDLARFLQIAMRSASELQYQLILARDLQYVRHDAHAELERELIEVRRMLNALIRKVRSDAHIGRVTRQAANS